MIYILCASLILLIYISAFFSASETSFLSISRITLRSLQKNKEPKADKIAKVKSNKDWLLTTILVGNNFVNNLASSLATAIAVSLTGDKGVGIATGVMTIVIIIFGEILPKTIAAVRPVQTAKRYVTPILFLEKVFFPIIWIFAGFSSFATKLIEKIKPQHTPLVTEDELKTLIDVGNQEGTLEKSEREMMYKIFEFTDLRVRDIIRHRSLVQSVCVNSSYSETVAAFAKSGYSRLPVYEDNFDSIVGLVHYKDVLFARRKTSVELFSLRKCMRKILFVPEAKTALALLHTFKIEKENFAVVVDEHGSNSGIVTMDDLLNAVFGRITDEYTTNDLKPEDRVTILSGSDFLVPGDLKLTDVNNLFRLTLDSDYYDTLGGWLLEQFGYLPSSSEMLKRNNWIFIVEEQSQRRIRSVRMRLVE